MVDPSKLQQYLKSVRERGQAWWKPCARFIEEIDDATWFEFGLKVKSVEPKSREKADKQKNQPQPVLAALNEYGNVPVLVIGSPGAGKSTFLAKVLFERANRTLNDPTAPIPVLIELKSYSESGLWGLIQAALEVYDLYVEVPEIKQLIAGKRLLLLADGVNELPEEKARLELTTFCRKQIPMIFTTRDLGGDLGIEQKLEIQPLRSDEVTTFLRDRLPRHDQKRVQELCDRVRDFGQTPLMVWMLYSVFQGAGEIPTTRGEAYRAFTALYAERAKEGIPLEESRSLLAKLAFEMMHSEKPPELRLDISEIDAQKLVGGEKTLNHLLKYHLLERQGHPGNRRVRFCHQSLQEYYAAEALLQKLPDISDYTLKRDYLNYLKWTQAIGLMLCLPEITDKQTMQVVKLALNIDLMLGARLSGKVKPQLIDLVVDQITNLKVSQILEVQLLLFNQSDVVIPRLIEALQQADVSISRSASEALGKLNSKVAIVELLKIAEHANLHVRRNVVVALGKLDDDIAIPCLHKALDDEDSSVRLRAISALRKIDNEIAIPNLLQKLDDPDFLVRYSTIQALESFKDETAVSALLEALKNSNPDVRLWAVEALEQIGGEAAVLGLVKASEDSEFFIQQRIENALERLKNEVKPQVISETLEYQNASENYQVVDSSIILDTEVSIETLSKDLKEEDFLTRLRAVSILGGISPGIAMPLLLIALEDSAPFVCRMAAAGLARSNNNGAVSSLLKTLNHLNSDVRWEAARSIGEIGNPEPLDELWRIQLHSSEISVLSAILKIQNHCGFYSYKVAQSAKEEESGVSGVGCGEGKQVINNTYIESVGILNTGNVDIQGDQVGELH